MTNAEQLRQLSGTEWPDAVGKLWDGVASRFATPWDQLAHHDQLAVYRLLTESAAPVAQPDMSTAQLRVVSTKLDGTEALTTYLTMPRNVAEQFVQTYDEAIGTSNGSHRHKVSIVE